MKLDSDIESLKSDILRKNLVIQNVLQKIQAPDVTGESLFLLNSEYRSEFKILKQLVEEFEKIVKEQDEDNEFRESAELYKHQLVTLQTAFRKANIQTQMNINMKNKSELLYSNSTEMEVRSRQGKSKEEILKVSRNMTSQLSDISQHLSSIVEQSKTTVDTLVQSSQNITDTQEEFKVMGSTILSAKRLVTRYGRRELTDMILIVFAACLFFACCVYVILKRMF